MQTRLYQIAYVPPQQTFLAGSVAEADSEVSVDNASSITPNDTSLYYLYVGGEFMALQSTDEANDTAKVIRGVLGTEAKKHQAGEEVYAGVIDPNGTDSRELRQIDSVDNPRVKEVGEIEQQLEYKKAKFRISNTSATVHDLPKDRLSQAGSIHNPWVFDVVEDGGGIIFSGILDGESVNYDAETRNTSFDVLSWLDILDRAGSVPARDVFEVGIDGTRESENGNGFVDENWSDIQIRLNNEARFADSDIGRPGDTAVIEGEDSEIRRQIAARKVDDDDRIILFINAKDQGDEEGQTLTTLPESGLSSKATSNLVGRFNQQFRVKLKDQSIIQKIITQVGGDVSDLEQGERKEIDVPNDFTLEVDIETTLQVVTATGSVLESEDRSVTYNVNELVYRYGSFQSSEPFIQIDGSIHTGVQVGGTGAPARDANETTDTKFKVRLKRNSTQGIVSDLGSKDEIKILGGDIYGYSGTINYGYVVDYDIQQVVRGLFNIEGADNTGRPQLGVLPHVFSEVDFDSINSGFTADGSKPLLSRGGVELPDDPMKALRMLQQRGKFLLKERFTEQTDPNGNPLPGYYTEMISRFDFFDTATEVTERRIKSWSEDVTENKVRAVIIRPNKDYLEGRSEPFVDKRIGFYFDGINRYEEDTTDAELLRKRMTPPEGDDVVEIEMPIMPVDKGGFIYQGGDEVVENNVFLKQIAKDYFNHFRNASRTVEFEFGNDEPEWMGGFWYFKNQGSVIDDFVFVTQETKKVEDNSITTSLKGRISGSSSSVVDAQPEAIVKGPREIGAADSAGEIQVYLNGESSFSLSDNPLSYNWERKPQGGNYSQVQAGGAILNETVTAIDSQKTFVYRLTVTDQVTGATDATEKTVILGPDRNRDFLPPEQPSYDYEVKTWQQDGRGYLAVMPDNPKSLGSVDKRAAVGGNIPKGEPFTSVSQFSAGIASINTTDDKVLVSGDYSEHFDRDFVSLIPDNGGNVFFEVASTSYDNGADQTTIQLNESIDSTAFSDATPFSYVTSIALNKKHTSAIEIRAQKTNDGSVETFTHTFDFDSLAEVDASVYNDESGAVYADVSGDEDTDNFDLEYRINGGSWQTELTGQATDIVGYEVVQADSVTDGDNVEVRITPYNFDGEQGSVVLRATFYNRSTGGGAQFDGVTVNGAGTIDSVNTGEFRFRDGNGDDAAKIDVFNVDLHQINGVKVGKYARTDQAETFSQDVTVQGNLTVNGTEFITNTETVEIQDNLAIINNGETGSGVTEGFSGWQVDRGSLTDYFFGFDEGRDRFVVGEGTTGRQVVATREDPSNVTPDGLAVFNSTANRFDTEQQGSSGTVNVDEVDGYDAADFLPNEGANIAVGFLPDPTIAVSPQGENSGLNAGQLHGYTGDKYPRKAENASISGSWSFSDTVTLDGTTLKTQGAATGFSSSGVIIDDVESWFEDLQVRGSLIAREFELRKITVTKGDHVFGPGGGKIEEVTGFGPYTLTFAEPSGLQPDDLCLIQESDLGNGDRTIIKQVELFVDSTANQTKEVTVSVNGTGTPEKGDDVVVVGSSTDTTRDSSVFLSPYGPFIDTLDGINSFSEWNNRTPKARFGKIDGAPDLSAGPSPSGHGLWAKNAYLEGTIVANSGEIADSVTVGGTNASDLASSGDIPESSVTIRSTTAPQYRSDGSPVQEGDVWIDTTDTDGDGEGEDIPHTYDGTDPYDSSGWIQSYTSIDGGFIKTGKVAADRINVAEIKIGDLEDDGTYATESSVTIRSTTAPQYRDSGDPVQKGDTWIDTTDLNGDGEGEDIPHTYKGDTNGSYDSGQWVRSFTSIDGGNIRTGTIQLDRLSFANSTEGYIDAQYLNINADDLTISSNTTFVGSPITDSVLSNDYTTLGDESQTFRQSSAPTNFDANGRNLQKGDVWIDTSDGNAPHVYTGSDWEASNTDIPGSFLSDDYTVAGNESQTFRQSSEPTDNDANGRSLQTGDIWIDTDDGNNPHVYDGPNNQWEAAYTNIDGGNIETNTIKLNTLAFRNNNGEIKADALGITASDLTINATDVEFSPVESNEVIVAINNSNESVNINSDTLKIDSNTTFASNYDPSTKAEPSDIPDSSLTIRDSSEPTSRPDGSALEDGDIWIDTSDGNNPHVYDGPNNKWEREYTEINGGDITTGEVDAGQIDVDGIFATDAQVESNLTIGSSFTSGVLQSYNFSDTEGWQITDQTATFQDGKFRGTFNVESGTLSDLEVQGQLTFPSTYDSSQIRIGSGANAFFVGDFSLLGSGQGSGFPDINDSVTADFAGQTVNGGRQDDYNDSGIGGASVTVEVPYSSTNSSSGDLFDNQDPSTSVSITIYVREKDGGSLVQERSKSPFVSLTADETATFSFTADSSTDEIEVETELEATMGANEEFYDSVTISNDDADVDWSNAQDFVGPGGALWRDDNGNVMIEINGGGYLGNETSDVGDISIAGSYQTHSDLSQKSNVERIGDALGTLRDIPGVTFVKDGREKREAGVVADSVQDAGFTPGFNRAASDVLTVDLMSLIGLNIEATRELDTIVQDNTSRIEDLERENKELRKEVKRLKTQD